VVHKWQIPLLWCRVAHLCGAHIDHTWNPYAAFPFCASSQGIFPSVLDFQTEHNRRVDISETEHIQIIVGFTICSSSAGNRILNGKERITWFITKCANDCITAFEWSILSVPMVLANKWQLKILSDIQIPPPKCTQYEKSKEGNLCCQSVLSLFFRGQSWQSIHSSNC
jgi:hypothetical protein